MRNGHIYSILESYILNLVMNLIQKIQNRIIFVIDYIRILVDII